MLFGPAGREIRLRPRPQVAHQEALVVEISFLGVVAEPWTVPKKRHNDRRVVRVVEVFRQNLAKRIAPRRADAARDWVQVNEPMGLSGGGAGGSQHAQNESTAGSQHAHGESF